jgi:hypothetical protein
VFNFSMASIRTEDFRFRHARPGLKTAREAFALHKCFERSEHAASRSAGTAMEIRALPRSLIYDLAGYVSSLNYLVGRVGAQHEPSSSYWKSHPSEP